MKSQLLEVMDGQDNETLQGLKAFQGKDIVDNVVRLGAMNLYLHGIGGGDECPIEAGDRLIAPPSEHFEMVLTNEPTPLMTRSMLNCWRWQMPMTNDTRQILEFPLHVKAKKALLEAVTEVIEAHRRTEEPLVVHPVNQGLLERSVRRMLRMTATDTRAGNGERTRSTRGWVANPMASG